MPIKRYGDRISQNPKVITSEENMSVKSETATGSASMSKEKELNHKVEAKDAVQNSR